MELRRPARFDPTISMNNLRQAMDLAVAHKPHKPSPSSYLERIIPILDSINVMPHADDKWRYGKCIKGPDGKAHKIHFATVTAGQEKLFACLNRRTSRSEPAMFFFSKEKGEYGRKRINNLLFTRAGGLVKLESGLVGTSKSPSVRTYLRSFLHLEAFLEVAMLYTGACPERRLVRSDRRLALGLYEICSRLPPVHGALELHTSFGPPVIVASDTLASSKCAIRSNQDSSASVDDDQHPIHTGTVSFQYQSNRLR